jgi:hypothetical protein
MHMRLNFPSPYAEIGKGMFKVIIDSDMDTANITLGRW